MFPMLRGMEVANILEDMGHKTVQVPVLLIQTAINKAIVSLVVRGDTTHACPQCRVNLVE